MNSSPSKNVRKLAKERKIKYYCCKSREDLCKELGIENKLGKTAQRETTLRHVRDGELFCFPSINAVARAVDRNSASVTWYEKTKKSMYVIGPGLVVPPGRYIVTKA